ncbi:MAG: hypothetical protein HQ565_04575 [Bacteroidetes bacterium]|nr:hypothetical protein [Bacteroidota bacterium]
MKKLFYVFVVLSFTMFSCGGSAEQTEEISDEAVNIEESDVAADDDVAKTCDEFLDDYEKWTDDYLEILEAYVKDPTNLEIGEEYTELSESMMTWYTDWSNYAACAQKEEFQKRFEAISDKIDKKMQELGLQD